MGMFDDLIPGGSPPAQMMPGAQKPIPATATPNLAAATGQGQQPAPQQAQPQPAPQGLFDDLIPKQPVPQNSLAGTGKALGYGAARGAAGLIGLPGDAWNLANRALGRGDDYGKTWGSEAAQKGIDKSFGLDSNYQPQTGLEKVAHTVGEFLPGAALPAGDASIGARLLKLTLAPALGSEAAGRLTEGTAAEPYARIAGGVAGGLAASKISNMLDARSAAAANPMQGAEQLRQIADAGYKSPALSAVQFKNDAISDLQNQMRSATLTPQLSPTTHGIIDTLNKPVAGKANFGWEDVQQARQLLGKEAGNFANPVSQNAAAKAKEAIDGWLDNLNQSQLMSGDANAAVQTYRTANKNYQVVKALDLLQGKQDAAELNAAAANSGQNFENAMRQRIKGILLSPKQLSQFQSLPNGLGDTVVQAMNDVVRGGKVDNLLRALSNIVGGGGGMHAGLIGLGGLAMGHPEAALAPMTGWALKKMGNRSVNSKLNDITNAITQSAPANQSALQARNAALAARLQGMSPAQRALVNAALARNQALLPQQQTQ